MLKRIVLPPRARSTPGDDTAVNYTRQRAPVGLDLVSLQQLDGQALEGRFIGFAEQFTVDSPVTAEEIGRRQADDGVLAGTRLLLVEQGRVADSDAEGRSACER
jgi:hypothetical protein